MSDTTSLDKAILGDVAMVIKTMLINPDRGGDTNNEISLIENPGNFLRIESQILTGRSAKVDGLRKWMVLKLQSVRSKRVKRTVFTKRTVSRHETGRSRKLEVYGPEIDRLSVKIPLKRPSTIVLDRLLFGKWPSSLPQDRPLSSNCLI